MTLKERAASFGSDQFLLIFAQRINGLRWTVALEERPQNHAPIATKLDGVSRRYERAHATAIEAGLEAESCRNVLDPLPVGDSPINQKSGRTHSTHIGV
ncbi:hypothetical protein [Sphingobium sp. CCH11-B1]|jgi:hypothetical protein|uniref:hypothetical protein n=1 Tax=Sphingobium sp. CCH11-B1 TaxID=1768781 RepID=UPI00082EBBD9|nr:hypothetical protein [Sphingobium sp. CCH11-B1]